MPHSHLAHLQDMQRRMLSREERPRTKFDDHVAESYALAMDEVVAAREAGKEDRRRCAKLWIVTRNG